MPRLLCGLLALGFLSGAADGRAATWYFEKLAGQSLCSVGVWPSLSEAGARHHGTLQDCLDRLLQDNDTLVLDGAEAGVTYGSGDYSAPGWGVYTRGRSGLTIRAPLASDPDFDRHAGPVTIDGAGAFRSPTFRIERSLTLQGLNIVGQGNDHLAAAWIAPDLPAGSVIRFQDCVFAGNTGENGPRGDSGGAIQVAAGGQPFRLEITGCTFTGNRARWHGGAVFVGRQADVFIAGSRFEGNSARQGGAVHTGEAGACSGRQVRVVDSRFTGNTAWASSGALRVLSTDLAITDTVFLDNQANPDQETLQADGGAVSAINSCAGEPFDMTVEVERSTFAGNRVGHRYDALGGGLHVMGNSDCHRLFLSVRQAAFLGNFANEGGGLYLGFNVRGSVEETWLAGNTARWYGGAAVRGGEYIFGDFSRAEAVFRSCVFLDNRAGFEPDRRTPAVPIPDQDPRGGQGKGGALHAFAATALTVTGSLFLDNEASGTGMPSGYGDSVYATDWRPAAYAGQPVGQGVLAGNIFWGQGSQEEVYAQEQSDPKWTTVAGNAVAPGEIRLPLSPVSDILSLGENPFPPSWLLPAASDLLPPGMEARFLPALAAGALQPAASLALVLPSQGVVCLAAQDDGSYGDPIPMGAVADLAGALLAEDATGEGAIRVVVIDDGNGQGRRIQVVGRPASRPVPGDLDRDQDLDLDDLALLAQGLSRCQADEGFMPAGDLDRDGCLGRSDLKRWAGLYRFVQAQRIGDLDGDGLVTAVDGERLAGALGTAAGQAGYMPKADLDGSGKVDRRDLGQWQRVARLVTAQGLADLNGDWQVDRADAQVLQEAMGRCRPDSGFLSSADLDNDGCIGAGDAAVWRRLQQVGQGRR
ncbi:MAG: right-handed parallel beta-helix repeat-containing protein [Thermodesulfobacteriota bacterium]